MDELSILASYALRGAILISVSVVFLLQLLIFPLRLALPTANPASVRICENQGTFPLACKISRPPR